MNSTILKKSCHLPTVTEEFAKRSKRYAINPAGKKWDHYNITYRIVQFPSTLNKNETRKAIAAAFKIWSDISPLTFKEVPPENESDIKLGFYTFNHTDCWFSLLHPCFDGLNGELAHAFLPPLGEIHFDNHEFWILGESRFSWKQGVWLNDLVQIAGHEIGHALGLWHSRDVKALMHPNATYMRTRQVSQDDIWGIQRLYDSQWATPATISHMPNITIKYVPKGRIVTFRCGKNISRSRINVRWYKNGELLSQSVPGYITLRNKDLSIIANELNEGEYTCKICRRNTTVRSHSWLIKLQQDNVDY
ncbi:matrix metalloproteinase-23-like [Protopterus annectens]|uniref:matrix metalloproteinase-23-like n=1 Tax=Protopterus annectens TaxID=7888 RepID=UPI001CFBFF08|nr:matrix metalloproteinase-23-like [Protopterus annectens]